MGALLKIYTCIFVQFLSNFSCGKTVWMRLKASPALKGLTIVGPNVDDIRFASRTKDSSVNIYWSLSWFAVFGDHFGFSPVSYDSWSWTNCQKLAETLYYAIVKYSFGEEFVLGFVKKSLNFPTLCGVGHGSLYSFYPVQSAFVNIAVTESDLHPEVL